MTSPTAELQKAIVAALNASATVEAVLGDPVRIYDRPPQSVVYPYAEFGEFQEVEAGSSCHDAVEVFVTIHVWSRVVGSVETKNIVQAIRTTLHDTEPTLTDHRTVGLFFDGSRVFDDPDGITTHGVITLRALIDEA